MEVIINPRRAPYNPTKLPNIGSGEKSKIAKFEMKRIITIRIENKKLLTASRTKDSFCFFTIVL